MGCSSCGNPRTVDLSNIDFVSTCPLGNKGCSACGQVEQLQHDIRETSQKLVGLLEKLEATKSAVNRTHSSLLNRVPKEVFSEIFRVLFDGVPPHEISRVFGVEEQRTNRKILVSLRLAAVSRQWRDVALSSSHIWTNIHIPLHRQTNGASLAILKELLGRSKPLPLTVSLFSKSMDMNIVWLEASDFRAVLSALGEDSARWNLIYICLPLALMPLFFEAIGKLPNVRSLYVHSNDSNDRKGAKKPVPLWGAQNDLQPRHLSFTQSTHNNFKIRWNNVTHVVAHDLSTKQATQLLRCAPSLESLTLENVDETSSIPANMRKSCFVHQNLRHIFYGSGDCLEGSENFFSFNDFPALTHLQYQAFKSSDEPLLECIERSDMSLLELRIKDANLESDYLFVLLQACPTLTLFEFAPYPPEDEFDDYNIDSVLNTFADCNSANNASNSMLDPFLPQLRTFKFNSAWVFPWRLVPKFFGALDDPHRRPLQNFVLVNIEDFSGDFVIPKGVLIQLLDLKRRGLDIQYYKQNDNTDLFQESSRFHNLTE